jgi:hypothetical protein
MVPLGSPQRGSEALQAHAVLSVLPGSREGVPALVVVSAPPTTASRIWEDRGSRGVASKRHLVCFLRQLPFFAAAGEGNFLPERRIAKRRGDG